MGKRKICYLCDPDPTHPLDQGLNICENVNPVWIHSNIQTCLVLIICFYSTKKKKMADKILPQRVSINQTAVHGHSLILAFIVLVKLHVLVRLNFNSGGSTQMKVGLWRDLFKVLEFRVHCLSDSDSEHLRLLT